MAELSDISVVFNVSKDKTFGVFDIGNSVWVTFEGTGDGDGDKGDNCLDGDDMGVSEMLDIEGLCTVNGVSSFSEFADSEGVVGNKVSLFDS